MNADMAIYAIADLHLSLGTNKPMDVFSGWDNYVERLKNNWCKIVNEEDTVVIAGDISWAMKLEETETDFRFIHSLPGKKLLIKGNHDYWFSTMNKMNNYLFEKEFDSIRIIHNSFEAVGELGICGTRGWVYNGTDCESEKIVKREANRLKVSIEEAIKAGKEPLVFLHYPPVYDIYVCDEIMEILKQFDIKDCFFGHIHGKEASKKVILGDYEGIKMRLIACDYLDFMPYLVTK